MNLKKIHSEDLLFTNEIEDDRTNTFLQLNDYDWMDYKLTTKFKTKEQGVLDVEFNYFGMVTSTMKVTQSRNDVVEIETATYEYNTEIFKKHIIKFLDKHISFWNSQYAFNGEEEVIEFFNDVIENGKIVQC